MASYNMSASILLSAAVPALRSPRSAPVQRRLVVTSAAVKSSEAVRPLTDDKNNESTNNGRRDVMFAVAAAAMCYVAGMALADEPKRGSPQAKKVYAPICVTMPTARICHN